MTPSLSMAMSAVSNEPSFKWKIRAFLMTRLAFLTPIAMSILFDMLIR